MDSDIEDTEYDPDDDLAVDSPSEDYGKMEPYLDYPHFTTWGKVERSEVKKRKVGIGLPGH